MVDTLEEINTVKKRILELEKNVHAHDITDDTVLLAIDMNGGMCDRLMLGRLGLVNNANASIESWNIDRDEDERMDLFPTNNITTDTLEHALNILYVDNFSIVKTDKTIMTEDYIIGKDIEILTTTSKFTVIDLYKVEYTNNLYSIL